MDYSQPVTLFAAPVAVEGDLTTADRAELGRYEAVIQRGLQTFVEVGNALLAIRDGRLYRGEHETFEAYCQARWGFTRMRASQLIAAAEVATNVNPGLQAGEKHMRPLTRLDPDAQREAWAKAVETAPNGKVTAAHVQRVVSEFVEPPAPQLPALVELMIDPRVDETTMLPNSLHWAIKQATANELNEALRLLPHSLAAGRGPVLEAALKKRGGVAAMVTERATEPIAADEAVNNVNNAPAQRAKTEYWSPAPVVTPLAPKPTWEEKFQADMDAYDADAQAEIDAVVTPASAPHKLSVHFSSDTPEHYTPAAILDAVVACLGVIDLDPCSNSKRDPNVPATTHYTQDDDGLAQSWHGSVYMNPPYGREIGKWVTKLREEYDAGNVTEAIALVPARTDTDWFDRLIDGYRLHCFVHGRLTFIGNSESAPFPSAIVYLGDNDRAFYDTFRAFGRVVQELHTDMIVGES